MFKSGVFYNKPNSSIGQRRPEGLLDGEFPDVYVSYKNRGNSSFKYDVIKPLQAQGLTVYVDYLRPTSKVNSVEIADNIAEIIDRSQSLLFVLDDENDERWYTPFAFGLAAMRRIYLGLHILNVKKNINFLPGYLKTTGFVSENPIQLYDWANIVSTYINRDEDTNYRITFEDDIIASFNTAVQYNEGIEKE